jgi:hypothetical protein
MGGLARPLWILGKVFYPVVDETVIIKAGSKVLFCILYILINGKGSRVAESWRASHRLSSWQGFEAYIQTAF